MNILIFSSDRADIIAALPSPADETAVVDSAARASARLAQGGIDLVILDLAAGDALRFLRKQPLQKVRASIVCVADRHQPDASSEALRLGAADIIGRPVRPADLAAAIDNAREMVRLAQRPQASIEVSRETDGVFGASPAMRDVLGIVRRVAESRCGVLIVGESGTGREMVARAIHSQGPWHEQPFVRFLCSDASPSALDAVLAAGSREGGTVYFEDLCDLAPELQQRIESARGAQARLIASAQPRVDDLVEQGRLRRSLVETLGVVRIALPPLRQRAQDVPLLAVHFLKDACAHNDVPPKTFSRSALTLLASLPWRGNAGELRSLTERLAVLVPRGVVLLEDVLASVHLDGAEAIGRARGTLKDARARFERDYLTTVLEHHKGRMGAAAKELGIERTNLYRKIKQLNIRWTIPD